MDKVVTSIRITGELHKRLTEEAKRLGISFNALVAMKLSGKGV